MKRFRMVAAVTALLGFAGLWAAFAAPTVDLTSVDKVGWWSRRPGAQPTGNPANFEIASDVQGDASVAALRILIRGSVTKATLVLGEADAPFKDVITPTLKVCTTSVPWLLQPNLDGGPWADAPAPDCSNEVELTRAKDAAGNGSWSADVTNMLAGARSEVSLMVLPLENKADLVPPTYYVKFLARVDAEGTPDVVTSVAPAPEAPVVPPAASTPSVTTPTRTVTPTPAGSAPATTIASAPAPATDAAAQPRRFTVASAPKEKKPWGKLFLLIPLAVIGAALFTGGRKYWEQRLAGAAT